MVQINSFTLTYLYLFKHIFVNSITFVIVKNHLEIVLPLLRPAFVTVLILNGIWIWNDFLLPLLVLGSAGQVQTIPLAVTAFAGAYLKQWDLILTSALLAMIPIIVLFLFAQRYIIKGMVEGAIK